MAKSYKISWPWTFTVSNYLGRGRWFGWRATWGEYVNGGEPNPMNDRLWCWTLTLFRISIALQVEKSVRGLVLTPNGLRPLDAPWEYRG